MRIQCSGEETRLTLVCLSLLYVLHYWRPHILQVLTISDKTCVSLALKKLPRFSAGQRLTQLVASNILRSRGSPWMVSSRRIREWQLAMAAHSGPQGKALPEAKLWTSWKLKEKRERASAQFSIQNGASRGDFLKSNLMCFVTLYTHSPITQINSASFSHHPYMSSVKMRKSFKIFSYSFSGIDLIPEVWKELEVSPLILSTSTPAPTLRPFHFQCCETEQLCSCYGYLCTCVFPSLILWGRAMPSVSLQHVWPTLDRKQMHE